MFKKFERMLKKHKYHLPLWGLLAIVLLGLALAPFLRKWANPLQEGMAQGGTELVFYHMNECHHCKEFMPVWDDFVKQNSSSIQTRKAEQSEVPDEISQHGITGFPTVLLLDGAGKKVEVYEGARTLDALNKYVGGD